MGGQSSTLQLGRTDLLQSKNVSAHRTSAFMGQNLIVRRGEEFSIDLTFSRPVKSSDNIKLNINSGFINIDLPILIPSPTHGAPWSASSTQKTNTLTISIKSPVNAVIGRYGMTLSFSSGWSTTTESLGHVYVLFNPWAKDDAVYMENEAEKKEYVLNEAGIIFFGSSSTLRPRPWDFGQFQEDMLDITLKILDKSTEHKRDPKKDMDSRNDPVHVGRMLSAMMNSQNDSGVVMGNWSGDYSGGKTPTNWNGSADILRQWMKSGPVQFGQCWVFAGVLCTVLRCLGIPARVITNFSSAHDTDENLIIDRYFDEDGVETVESSDSIWNFHVWVEAWFARSDLGPAYDGWQVLDATPQEISEGLYRLGPCSVNAIKEGDVDLEYDAPFVFAEMNADIVDWSVSSDESKKKIKSNTRTVGKLTSTKAINSDERVDVTNNYKYPEGTPKEREIFRKAQSKLKGSGLRRSAVAFSASVAEAPKPDFSGNFTSSSNIEFGQDVIFNLDLKNTSANEISVQINLTASAIIYTNATFKDVLTNAQSVKLEPNEEKNIPYTIPYAEYENAITTDNMIKVLAMCEDEKGIKLLVETVILLQNPPIVMKITDQAHLNKPLTVTIAFTNPTAEEVHNCVLVVEGSGLVKEKVVIEVPHLSKNEKYVSKIDIVPYQPGQRCLLVDFSCDKISDVKGSLKINVAPN